MIVLVQNKYKNTLVGVLRTQMTFVTHSSPSCYVTLRTQVIRLNSCNLGPQKTDSGVFTIISTTMHCKSVKMEDIWFILYRTSKHHHVIILLWLWLNFSTVKQFHLEWCTEGQADRSTDKWTEICQQTLSSDRRQLEWSLV